MSELPPMELHPEFGDVDAMLNSRDWLEAALIAKGATVTGKGFGMGECDVSIKLQGFNFMITMRPF